MGEARQLNAGSEKDPVLFVANLSEVGNRGRARVRNESEPVAGGKRRRGGDLDLCQGLDKVASELIPRIGESVHPPLDTAPFDAQRVNDAFNKIPQRPGDGKTVGDSERVEDTDIIDVQRSSACCHVRLYTAFRDCGDPEDASRRDAGIVRVRAQRARA
jgi:hypothetical protein